MPRILQLSPHVADLIAAGEVVERPGSVIKELMENAIDAGATHITVEIRRGGMAYMRVTDNGCGICPDDAATAFLRHATSKLRDEKGLEAIGTLGFRGEALAAISAVSHMEMLTRETGAMEGTRVTVDGGDITEVCPAGCPEGTTMVVRDLFFNTPARLKFMKNDKAEGANVTSVVLHCAMSHPEVSVRYVREDKEEFHTPGDGKIDSCIYSLLGREFAAGMLKTETENDGIGVSGYVCPPSAARGNRSYQFFFVNGRMVKSRTLQAALEQAYKNRLFTGRFPSCVLYITMSTSAVDVNVHPAKTEVRFLNEKAVFDGVYYAVLGALSREAEHPTFHLADSKPTESKEVTASSLPKTSLHAGASGTVTARSTFFKTVTAEQFRGQAKTAATPIPKREPVTPPAEERKSFSLHDSMRGMASAIYSRGIREETKPSAAYASEITEKPVQEEIVLPKPEQLPEEVPVPKQEKSTETEKLPEYRIIGEALGTYILVERDDSLILIDKHAAHERIIFDKLKTHSNEVMAQYLVEPVVVHLPERECTKLLQEQETLHKLGFDVDDFGNHALAVRQVPADMDCEEIPGMLEELAEKLSVSGRLESESPEDKILHTVACKAAIKAGRRSDRKELESVARQVMLGKVKYCPHGRPVAVTLTKNEIDKNFKRV